MERSTKKIAADESSSSGANPATAMRHLVGVCLRGIGGCGFVSDIYNEFVTRFDVTKSDRLSQLMHDRLRRSDFVTVFKKVKYGKKFPSNFYTLDESKFEAFLQKCGICRSKERCLQIVNASLTYDHHAITAPARKQVLEIPSSKFIAMIIDCLESECGGSPTLGPIVAAVAARLNLPAENAGRNGTIYQRVKWFLHRSGRFQSTGPGRVCAWTVLERSKSQEQERPRLQKRVLEIPSDEFITTMIDCLENECGGSSTLGSIVTAVAARLNLPTEESGRKSTIYQRVQRFLLQSGRFQSTGPGCASTWIVLGRLNSQEWSQPAANAFLRRMRKREQKNAAAERRKCKRQREIAELERKAKELEIEFGNEPQQNASDEIEGLSDAEIKFDPETGCLVISMESGRIRQLVATSNSTRMAISTVDELPALGARILDAQNGSTFRPEWSGDRKQIRLSRQENDIDELLQGD